ncbi:MAG: glycogen/starch synthase [Patescibacteria group bacterium]|nr:glycogen/starch synthase [Patescibacteria group bacterium]
MKKKNLKVLFITAELSPFAAVGGLAFVARSLPKALKNLGADVRIVMPKYRIISAKKYGLKKIIKNIEVEFDGKKEKIDIWRGYLPQSEVPVYFIDNKRYFGKGKIYFTGNASSDGTVSEFKRFGFFDKAVFEIFSALDWHPDILHCHDWHTGFIPLLRKQLNGKNKKLASMKTVFTIHNLAYQGWYKKSLIYKILDLEKGSFQAKKNWISAMRQGILTANVVNTVSKSYAKEILTKEFGCGMNEALKTRKKDLIGILNGLDVKRFNPSADKNIKFRYSRKNFIKGKKENKIYLQKKLGLDANSDIPLIGMVGRLAEQKGFDILIPILNDVAKAGAQVVIVGPGSKKYKDKIMKAAKKYRDRIVLSYGFSFETAQMTYAASDFLLVPSRFEPCGLVQMIAMLYGAVPIARATGGLKDTVIDYKMMDKKASNGFLFKKYESDILLKTIKRALKVYDNKKDFRQLQLNGMAEDFSWNASAKKYLSLYEKLRG